MQSSAYDPEARTAGTMPVWRPDLSGAARTAKYTPDSLAPAAGNPPDSTENFGFLDFLDIVNPLQHLPIVSFIYREITDDQIKPVSKIAGGGLYGGLAGAAASAVNVIVEEETGKDIPENLVALVSGDSSKSQLAANTPQPVERTPLPDLTPLKETDIPEQQARIDTLPGTVLALADLRKPAMRSFVLNS